MNSSMKGLSVYSQLSRLQPRAATFHSTPVLLHHYKRSQNRKSFGKMQFGKNQAKQTFSFYNKAYAEGASKLLGSYACDGPPSKGGRFGKQRPGTNSQVGKGQPPWFYIFNQKTQKTRFSTHEQSPRIYWNWRELTDTEESSGSDDDYEAPTHVDLSSHRRTLGLSASGPLTMVVLKKAYRGCALKWHPDRHQGASKAMAERNFKNCSAAYQSLCDNLNLG